MLYVHFMFQTSPSTRASLLRDLRETIARIERAGPATTSQALPIGLEPIDRALPAGGLALGALHEAMGPDHEQAAAATLFVAGLLTRLPGPVLWVLRQADLFAPGLADVGLTPDRVIFAEAGKDVLPAMEEGLRHGGLASVVGEVAGRLSLVASRRLQLAAEQTGVLAIVLRRGRGAEGASSTEPTAAMTRWLVTPLPSPPVLEHAPTTPGLGRAHWRLDLLRCRGGEPGSWIVEACDATGCLALVPAFRDGSAAPAWRGPAQRGAAQRGAA